MFDDFINSQDIAYSILKNSIDSNKLSHAYLIDANGSSDAKKFVMSFVKVIFCKDNYTNFKSCGECNKCNRIDNNNFSEIKIIEPDGLVIKKDQLLELQEDFSLSGIESDKRVYIIYECDKMTAQASNSLLKFLEEPNDGIIAILVTNNFNKLLSTIVSRCQIIKLKKDSVSFGDRALINFSLLYGEGNEEFLCDKRYSDMIDAVVDFVYYYENNGIDIIIYMKKFWYSYFKERIDNIMAVDLLINFYYDVLKLKSGKNNLFFCDYIDRLNEVVNCNDVSSIIHKLNVCIDTLEMLKCNLNINLLIDSMVFKLGGVNNGSSEN